MCRETILVIALLFISGAASIQHIESELSQTPKLFHLDDYVKCLDKKDGIYCLGQFQVYSEVENHPTFELIQKYSRDPYLYNRTYLHRGYCLNTRCAGAEANLTARFERCVDKWARHRHGLRARLVTLNFCKEHGKPIPTAADTRDTAHRAFIYVVIMLLVLNAIGTYYDMSVEDKNKGHVIRTWSIVGNWKTFVATPPPDADNRMDSLVGWKAFLSLGPIYCHATIFITAVYQHNPRFMEKFLLSPAGPMVGALTTATQGFTLISTFLSAFNVMMRPKIGWTDIPKIVLKRLARILPVYLLVVGFASTWWHSIGDGPMWHLLVGTEGPVCRRKFWTIASFIPNLFDKKHICLVQTWTTVVDMQLLIPVLVLTVLLIKYHKWATVILSALFAAAVAATAHVVFKNHYKPAYTYMTPEDYREFFSNNKSFVEFFMLPYNCLIMTVAGIWTAVIQKDIHDRKINLAERKSLVFISYIPFTSIWIWAFNSYYLKEITDPRLVSLMVILERLALGAIMSIFLILMMNVNTKMMSVLRWNKLHPFSRMSLSVVMVHWCVNSVLVGFRYTLYDASVTGLILDTIGVFVVSCILAVPLTIMVETPMRKTASYLLYLYETS